MKNRNIESVPAVKNLIDFLNEYPRRTDPNLLAEIENVLDGVERLDREVKLKTVEVQNKDNLLIQKEQVIVQKDKYLEQLQLTIVDKEQQELIKILPKLYPGYYPTNFNNWPNDWGRTVIENNNSEEIKKHLPGFKQQLLKKELIDILPKLYPGYYPTDFKDWPNDWGRTVIENNNFEEIKKHLPHYKQELLKKEFIDTLHKLYPTYYPADFNNWPNDWGRTVINTNNFKAIKDWLNIYKKQLTENLNQSVLTKEKALSEQKENEVKKLTDKDKLLSDKELKIARLEDEITKLTDLVKELSHIDIGCQNNLGNEKGCQVDGIDLIGDQEGI